MSDKGHMDLRPSLAILSLLLLCSVAHAGHFDRIARSLESRPYRTFAEVGQLLPTEMKDEFTFMFESESSQDASPLAPRAILFTQDGLLSCAFNGHPGQEGHDVLECWEYVEKERAYDFRAIELPSPQNSLKKARLSPRNQTTDGKTDCRSCHGKDPHPNWQTYVSWKGAYGSMQGELIDNNNEEAKNFLKFKAGITASSRYAFLSFPKTEGPLYPYNKGFGGGHVPRLVETLG